MLNSGGVLQERIDCRSSLVKKQIRFLNHGGRLHLGDEWFSGTSRNTRASDDASAGLALVNTRLASG